MKCEHGEAESLKKEVERLKAELTATRQTILRMHEREDRVKQRYWESQQVVNLEDDLGTVNGTV